MSLPDLAELLSRIRVHAIASVSTSWPDLGSRLNTLLPDPLDPVALLPVASGLAVGGRSEALVPVAAAIVLIETAFRITDDLVDGDEEHSLDRQIGAGRAATMALALNTIGTRVLATSCPALMDRYFTSFLAVCNGQDSDAAGSIMSLSEYINIVQRKTVAAYEFAVEAGALAVGADLQLATQCTKCGAHIGWMVQILDDIESLWFPVGARPNHLKPGFPVLLGMTLDNPEAVELQSLSMIPASRALLCSLLDVMQIRPRLLDLALDHRDKALYYLRDGFQQEGIDLLEIWLDWMLANADQLLGSVGAV